MGATAKYATRVAVSVLGASLLALPLPRGGGVTAPIATRSAPTIAGIGYGAYDPAAPTHPADSFDVLTLISGGQSSVNTNSLTIVTAPPGADGEATVTTSPSADIIKFAPASGVTGQPNLTFGICAAGYDWPNATECSVGTIKYLPATDTLMGDTVSISALGSTVNENVYLAAGDGSTFLISGLESRSVPAGSQVTMVSAPVSSSLPTSISAGGLTAVVNYETDFAAVIPVPAGLTFVSAKLIGGDASTAGQATVTECTSASHPAPCSATESGGNYADNAYPYIELSAPASLKIPGGTDFTLPTVESTFIATGIVGQTIDENLTELRVETNFTVLGHTASVTFDGFPADAAACPSDWRSNTSACKGLPSLAPEPLTAIASATITKVSTSTRLTLDSGSVPYGREQISSFAIVVGSSLLGPPAGTARVSVDGTGPTLCTATIANGGGKCSISSAATALLPAGDYKLDATYSGNNQFQSSSSPSVQMVVTRAGSKTTLGASAKSVAVGHEQTVRFTIGLSPQFAGAPTGTVIVSAGTKTLCTVTITLSNKGTGHCSSAASALSVGKYTLAASFAGDTDYIGSKSVGVPLVVT